MDKKSLANDAEKPVKLTEKQFGIMSDGTIKFLEHKEAKLSFELGQIDGKKVVIMNLSLIIDNDHSDIIIGPTDDTGFDTGRFDFSVVSNPHSVFESLSLFIEEDEEEEHEDSLNKKPPVRLVSASSDFDMVTAAEKIEHGSSLSPKVKKKN